MYYPYFRGKQNELILLREKADLIARSNFTPIIEPVKSNLRPIKKCLSALIEANASFVLIVNPKCGDLKEDNEELLNNLLSDEIGKYNNLVLGYILDENTTIDNFLAFNKKYSNFNIGLVHAGFSSGPELSGVLEKTDNIKAHYFIEKHAQKRYRKNFNNGTKRILIRDGFSKRSNREYPKVEHFSELHIMYEEESMDGFGDFSITGDDYSESGGPAYAVAIHLTYLDKNDENDMSIKHYVSDRNNSPADPGGKFLEALNKLVFDIEKDNRIFKSQAIREFKNLHEKMHYPGLGSIKKLSMQHHLELIADFFDGIKR
ncbi:MAG: sce7725 family protein [Pseudomonadales bacterium]